MKARNRQRRVDRRREVRNINMCLSQLAKIDWSKERKAELISISPPDRHNGILECWKIG